VSANQLPNDEPWEYRLLDQGVTQDQIKPAQARAVIQTSIQEVLFSLVSQPEASLTSRWYPDQQLSCQIALFQVEQLLQEAQQLWEQWQSAGLGHLQELLWRFSPDLSPTLKQPDQLQNQVSPGVYQTLTKLMDGQNTLWDVAVQMRRSVAVVTRSLLPFVQQGVIELREVPDLPSPALKSPSTSTASDSSKPLVACIDDSPLIGQSLEQILIPAGYRVLNIVDPLRAIATLLEHKPALIFLDLIMPNTNGYELCTFLRKTSAFRSTPIIILTGQDGLIDRVRARISGSSDFLSKPPEIEKVLQVVQKYLESVSAVE
jgi:chemotaxis family two-component system response regulator PixG